MKIHEDRSHMNIDTRWLEKGYAKEDVHSLRLQSLCTEAEAAANKQFYDSHTREEWEQYIRQASLESSAAMKPVMDCLLYTSDCSNGSGSRQCRSRRSRAWVWIRCV